MNSKLWPICWKWTCLHTHIEKLFVPHYTQKWRWRFPRTRRRQQADERLCWDTWNEAKCGIWNIGLTMKVTLDGVSDHRSNSVSSESNRIKHVTCAFTEILEKCFLPWFVFANIHIMSNSRKSQRIRHLIRIGLDGQDKNPTSCLLNTFEHLHSSGEHQKWFPWNLAIPHEQKS